MKSNSGGSYTRTLMLALGLFLALPLFAVSTQAQTGWWGNSPTQDRNRNGIDDRQERRARRQQRREVRRDRRQDRRQDRYNDGYYNNNGYGGYNNDNYGNYGGSYQLRQTALNAGYNNGMEEGRKDRQRNERFNYTDEGDYQSASKDYSSRMGDRGAYQRYFREAFARGYRDGYNGVGSNNGYYNDGYYRNY